MLTLTNPKRIAQSEAGPIKSFLITFAWILVLFNIFLVGWMILLSFKSTMDIFSKPISLPEIWSLFNYSEAFEIGEFRGAIFNTLWVSLACGVITILIASPTAYALSRFNMKNAGPFLIYFAMGIAIPSQLIIMPLYYLVMKMGMLNSLWGLLVLYVAGSLPFAVFFLTGFFASLDSELEEAATLDGSSAFYTFWYVMMPLARSGLITLFILNFIGHWNETMFALIFLQTDDKITLSVALLKFIEQVEYGSDAGYGGMFAGITMIVLPMLAVYIWASSRIIEGLTLGSGK